MAVELSGGTPAWISAWKAEDAQGPYWGLTIARGSSNSWEIALASSDETSPDPIEIETLARQNLPVASGKYTGQKWRLRASNNTLDLEITVPPG